MSSQPMKIETETAKNKTVNVLKHLLVSIRLPKAQNVKLRTVPNEDGGRQTRPKKDLKIVLS